MASLPIKQYPNTDFSVGKPGQPSEGLTPGNAVMGTTMSPPVPAAGTSPAGAPKAPGAMEPSTTQSAMEWARTRQGFVDPEYRNGKAEERAQQLTKEGIDLAKSDPQLLHMYMTGDSLAQSYAMMRLSGVLGADGKLSDSSSLDTLNTKLGQIDMDRTEAKQKHSLRNRDEVNSLARESPPGAWPDHNPQGAQ